MLPVGLLPPLLNKEDNKKFYFGVYDFRNKFFLLFKIAMKSYMGKYKGWKYAHSHYVV